MQRAKAGLALKKGVPKKAFFFFFPLSLSDSELPSGVPYVRFLQLQRPSPLSWAEALLGAVELFKNTCNNLTGMSQPLV